MCKILHNLNDRLSRMIGNQDKSTYLGEKTAQFHGRGFFDLQ